MDVYFTLQVEEEIEICSICSVDDFGFVAVHGCCCRSSAVQRWKRSWEWCKQLVMSCRRTPLSSRALSASCRVVILNWRLTTKHCDDELQTCNRYGLVCI